MDWEKRHSSDKLKVSSKLEWGITKFKSLGIEFSVDLKEISKLNYSKALNSIQKDVTKWNDTYKNFFYSRMYLLIDIL